MLENLNPNMIRATDVTCCVLTRGTTEATNVNVGPGRDTEQDRIGLRTWHETRKANAPQAGKGGISSKQGGQDHWVLGGLKGDELKTVLPVP